ncbi:MAG: hypothetical protein ABIQ31_19845, partial [Ferruginibacter sp.]
TDRKIQIKIYRSDQAPASLFHEYNTIDSVKVTDNGEGFTANNFASFKTAYSRENKDYGCKGIGRFTVLAAFGKIDIQSTYPENKKWYYRELSFDVNDEVKEIKMEETEDKNRKTVVTATGFNNTTLRDATAVSVHVIAEGIMEHCLVYYLCGDLPRIEVLEGEGTDIAVVNELYARVSKEAEKNFTAGDMSFNCFITKSQKTNNRKNHYIHYCANSRVAGAAKSLGKVNSLFAYPIQENGQLYCLDVYVVSEYLNKKVYSARNGFAIPQDRENGFFNELSFAEIEEAIAAKLEENYDEFTKATKDRNIREIEKFIINLAPKYKRYLGRPEILNSVPPNLSEDKRDEFLYRISIAEKKVIDSKIQKFIDNKEINVDTIEELKQELRGKTIFDADNLADYMFRRRSVLDIFKKFLDADQNGKYRLEEDIHNLIFPMGVTNKGAAYESHNLWMLDERFATFDFIGSDIPITTMSQKKSKLEVDIMMVDKPQMFDNPISFAAEPSGEITSMVIFEFKRPGETAYQKRKNDFRWEFNELIDKYFEAFIYGDDKKSKNYRGNTVVLRKDTPKFGYIIVDVIPPQLEEYNKNKGYKCTPFGTLYKIIPELNQHIEVITFNQLLRAVETRHAPFFDKLFTK